MPNESTSLLSFVKSCHQKKKKKIVLCLKIISKKKKKKEKKSSKHFFQKIMMTSSKILIFFSKNLKHFDTLTFLTKFEDNLTTRTVVSIGEVILSPPPEYEVKIPTPQNRVN